MTDSFIPIFVEAERVGCTAQYFLWTETGNEAELTRVAVALGCPADELDETLGWPSFLLGEDQRARAVEFGAVERSIGDWIASREGEV